MSTHTKRSAKAKAPAARPRAQGRDILVVGVGGQGVILISKVLALIGHRQGFEVKQSEVQGMAKRGGIVFSHIRLAPQVWSPTIAKGEADALIALEWAEGLRWLDYLKPDSGVFIADTRRIVPPFACRNRRHGATSAYARETPAEVLGKVAHGYALDATGIAAELGDSRAANTVLVGALSATVEDPAEDWIEVIEQLVPKASRAINRKAFEAGRAWVETARETPERVPEPVLAAPRPTQPPEVTVALEINAAWCKGCDICVKLCPERCLALDAKQVAVLAAPEACTGCRICEWLCPDFAISVRRIERQAAVA